MEGQWYSSLPRPIAFVFSGGASLGALQVGMLRALHAAGITPDLVVGTSIGALNGAVIADHGLNAGIELLADLWTKARCAELFAGGPLDQLRCLLQTRRSLFRPDALLHLLQATLAARAFADLQLPLGVVATDVLRRRSALLTAGDLPQALLASSAIPGLLPWVEIGGRRYVDGCFTENVPLAGACALGAASIVVLDAGNRRSVAPTHGVAAGLLARASASFRRQVLAAAPAVAQSVPLLYLPAPDLPPHSLLDFADGEALIDRAAACAGRFLAAAPAPARGAMSGSFRFCETQRPALPTLADSPTTYLVPA